MTSGHEAPWPSPPLLLPTDHDEVVRVGDLVVDRAAHTVSVCGHRIDLPMREYELLELMAVNVGRVVSKDDIVRLLWQGETRTNSVTVHVARLRHRLEGFPACAITLVTVRGLGFRLEGRLAGQPTTGDPWRPPPTVQGAVTG